jgi:hypothetical protein
MTGIGTSFKADNAKSNGITSVTPEMVGYAVALVCLRRWYTVPLADFTQFYLAATPHNWHQSFKADSMDLVALHQLVVYIFELNPEGDWAKDTIKYLTK